MPPELVRGSTETDHDHPHLRPPRQSNCSLIPINRCSPQPKLLLFVTVVTVVQWSASRKCHEKPRVKPENTWVFPDQGSEGRHAGQVHHCALRNHGRKPPGKAVKRKPDRQPAPKGGGPPPPSPKVNKNRLSALGAGPSGTSGRHERAPPRSPSPSSPPAKSPRPSVPASEYDSEFDFSDAEAQDRTAGVVHDAVQQAVMQYGYDDELFQAWRDGEIRRKDLPEEVVAMALDLCERWRAEQERCRRVHAAQRLSRDPGPSHSRSRSRSPNSCRSSVSGCDEG